MASLKKVLTIAGSDSSGGAGIQADIKTIAANNMYAMSVITALTAQNTLGVRGVLEADADFVKLQLDCIFDDIFPDSVKIGMVSNAQIIETIASALTERGAKNIVLDPVMVATSGSSLLGGGAQGALVKYLIPVSDIITPNIPEAQWLTGMSIKTESDMESAARLMHEKWGTAVLVKGGHSGSDASDYLFSDSGGVWFKSARIDNPNTHGTGCTLSSAIACALADGRSMEDSVRLAKEYVTGAIAAGLDIGRGRGPLMHNFKTVQGSE